MPTGLLLCDDLIFTSRIVGTGRDLGLELRAVKSLPALLEQARKQPPACVILDLSLAGSTIADTVLQLLQIAPELRIVAYGSHVDAATLKAARDAGCDPVLPRSQFVERLPAELPGWMQPVS
jgi:DNA-binding NarL/FixJ family response regulator